MYYYDILYDNYIRITYQTNYVKFRNFKYLILHVIRIKVIYYVTLIFVIFMK